MSTRKRTRARRRPRANDKTPHGRFHAWFVASGLSQADVGRLLGCTPEHVGYILGRDRAPGLKLAFRIEKVTADWDRGPIDAEEWVDAETRSSAAA